MRLRHVIYLFDITDDAEKTVGYKMVSEEPQGEFADVDTLAFQLNQTLGMIAAPVSMNDLVKFGEPL